MLTEEPLREYASERKLSEENVNASSTEVSSRVVLSEQLVMEWSSDNADETKLQQVMP